MNARIRLRRSLCAGMILLAMVSGIVRAAGPTTTPPAQVTPVSLAVGRSTVVKSATEIKRVSVTDPKIADIQMVSPTQVLVSGKAAGVTDMIVWTGDDEAHAVPINVGLDQVAIRTELASLLPGTKLDAHVSNGVLVVTGMLGRAEDAENLHRFLDASSLKYVDMTTIPGLRQVQIKVLIAEANRVAIRALGINAGYSDGRSFGASNVDLNQFGLKEDSDGLSIFGDSSPLSTVTLFGRAFVGSTAIQMFVSALAENQYMRVLAEPTLVAKSGESASFLAGGEFPIPVVQASAGATNTSVTIQYKEFGVRLHFRPTVLGENRIRLYVAPEASQLSNGTGAVQLQGFSIPAILTRRAETTMELNSGQTFAMAGLISQDTQARSARVPALGDLPILGNLFRSVRYQQGDTELVLLVTASLVEPESMAGTPPIPGQLHAVPNDWELYLLGRIHGEKSPKLSPADAKWMSEAGFGKLRGPGAWTTYHSAPAEAMPEVDSAASK